MARKDVQVKVTQVKAGAFAIQGVAVGEPGLAEFNGGVVQRKEVRLEAVRNGLILGVKDRFPDITKAGLGPSVDQ